VWIPDQIRIRTTDLRIRILTVLRMEALVALLRAAINHGPTDSLLSLVKGKDYGTQCVVDP
jgi:hypothetical protein